MEKTTIIGLAKVIAELEKENEYYRSQLTDVNRKIEEAEKKLIEKEGRNREIETKKEPF